MVQTKPMLYSTTHETPVGELTLVASDAGLRAILWPRLSPTRAGIQPRPHRDPNHPVLQRTAAQLDQYFAGTRTEFQVPVLSPGSPFQQAVWEQLRRIPYGETRSYEDVARALGTRRDAAAVGMHHRVVVVTRRLLKVWLWPVGPEISSRGSRAKVARIRVQRRI